jgi:hypothetical protein
MRNTGNYDPDEVLVLNADIRHLPSARRAASKASTTTAAAISNQHANLSARRHPVMPHERNAKLVNLA